MSYAIIRTAKLKSMGNIGGSLSHNYRTIETLNADEKRTPNNQHDLETKEEVISAIEERIPEKRRSDAVLCIEYLVTASPEWEGWDTKQQEDYFRQAKEWLEEKHGKENVITTSVHLDETTPHLVAYVVPLDEKGKLNCKSFLGGRQKLRELQTDFVAKVGKDYGLKRGVEGSKAKHKTIKQHYTDINIARSSDVKYECLAIKSDLPNTTMIESKKAYAEKVIDHVISDFEPVVKRAKSIMTDYNLQLVDNRILTDQLKDLTKKAKPYVQAIKGLSKAEIEEINQTIKDKRQDIDNIKARNRLIESPKIEKASNAPQAPKRTQIDILKEQIEQSKGLSKELKEQYNYFTDEVISRFGSEPKILESKLNAISEKVAENSAEIERKSKGIFR